jgi:acetyltransferase-like isoleucine patch superfamily enzyme
MMSTDRRGLDPRLFKSARNINSIWWHWAVNLVAASPVVDRPQRARLLCRAGLDVPHALIESGCFFFGERVTIGDWSWINHRCYFDSRDQITIGTICSLGMEVMLCTSTHHPGDATKRAGAYTSSPISIGDGSWIGTRAVILPGVAVAPGCVVGSGAVVVEDTEPHGLYAGVPARRIRDLTP